MKQIKRVINSMSEWVSLTLMIDKRFAKPDAKPLTVVLKPTEKTWEQLGYLHSEVLPKLAVALFEAGETKTNSERHAKYWLKVQIQYGKWVEFCDGVVFDPDSFQEADIEVLTNAIDVAIDACEARGVYVNPPRSKK